jgi:hypothetical protein
MDYAKDILDSLKRGERLKIPLCVYWNHKKKLFLIFDGGRRYSAGLKFGLTEFPCIVYPEITNEVEALLACIKHNDSTIAHSPFEIAYGVKRLLHEYMKTMDPEEAARARRV